MTGQLLKLAEHAFCSRKRLVAPLLGLPGVRLVGTTVKHAQRDPLTHARVLVSLFEAFSPDVLFPLMDLAVEAHALGRTTTFPANEPPTVHTTPLLPSELDALSVIDIRLDRRAQGYCETIRQMLGRLPPSVTLGSYVTGPYTLAALMMGAEDAAIATKLRTDELQAVLTLARSVIESYMQMHIDAGTQAVCILEPSAVMLGPKEFERFSADHIAWLRARSDCRGVPSILHVCGGSMHLIDQMVATQVDGLSLDSSDAGVDLEHVLERVPPEVVVLGNISPTSTMLSGNPEDVRCAIQDLGHRLRDHVNFILSTGCDLPLDTPLENIRAFMASGRRLTRAVSTS